MEPTRDFAAPSPGLSMPRDTPESVTERMPVGVAVDVLDEQIARGEQSMARLEERLGQVLQESAPLSANESKRARYGVPLADGLLHRGDRLEQLIDHLDMVIARIGV